VAGVLIDNGDDIAGATTAFRFAAHVTEDSPNRRAVLTGPDSFTDLVIGQHVAGTDDHCGSQFGKVSNYYL